MCNIVQEIISKIGYLKTIVFELNRKENDFLTKDQTDADVTSFDGGYGSAYLAKMVGQKKAREIFFLGRNYNAQEAFDMGMVNAVVPHTELEDTAYQWAQEIMTKVQKTMLQGIDRNTEEAKQMHFNQV